MKLKDIKVGKRMAIAFGIVIFIMVGVGSYGLWTLTEINTRLDQIVGSSDVKIGAAYDLRDALNATIRGSLLSFSTRDEADRKKSMSMIDASRQKYEAAMERIERLEDTEDGRALVKKIKDGIVSGEENRGKALALSKGGKAGEALSFFTASVLPAAATIVENCDALIKYEEQGRAVIATRAKAAYRSVMVVVIIASVFNPALGLTIAFILTRGIVVPIRQTIVKSKLLAEGDLRQEIVVDRRDEFGEQAAAVKVMVEKWREIIGSVKQASDNVASTGARLSASAGQMSEGAGIQAERAHQVATASEEMSQTVEDIAKNAASIASNAAQAASTAKSGGRTVSESVKEVKEIALKVQESEGHIASLSELSQKIGDIIGIIDEIADQTNLLALNAAIEAARAGEHGRGFAVVADEVRKLAERTTGATTEVSGIVREIQTKVGSAVASINQVSVKVEKGVDLSDKAGEELHAIVGSVEDLQQMVQQIATAIEEMSATSDQISRDIESISGISRETSQSSNEVLRTSDELSRLSGDLQSIARQFKL